MDDRSRIHVEAGAGGDGCLSFGREAHVPRGGPDGGDGGRGGDVVLVCDHSLRDLQGFTRRARYSARRGGNGGGSPRHRADGQALEMRVPPGTQVYGRGEGQVIDAPAGAIGTDDLVGRRWELLKDGQRAVVAHGGSGGRGKKRVANPTRPDA